MIAEARKVICESIPPFSTARINCSLDECDYVEEEYYIYGMELHPIFTKMIG